MAHTFAPFRNLEGVVTRPAAMPNVAMPERIGSCLGGLALVMYGVARRDLLGAVLGFVGTYLLYRGASGKCEFYRRLGIDTAGITDGRGVPGDAGVKVEKSIDVARSPMEVYHFWHQLTNLPEIMPHIVSITVDGARSHWIVRGPAGRQVEWDAEFINEKPGELIAWQSLPGADVQNAGSVHFSPLGEGESTRVKVTLQYLPIGGMAGAFIAYLLGSAPEQQLEADLARFKERMEAPSG
jgi:uncharacterized membrane protein